MQKLFDLISGSLKQSLSFGIFWRFGFASILSILINIFLLVTIFVPAFYLCAMPLLNIIDQSFQQSELLYLLMVQLQQNFFTVAIVFSIAIMLALFISNLLSAFFEAAFLLLSKDFLLKKKISFCNAAEQSIPKAFTIFKARIIIGIFLLIFYFILMLPAISTGLKAVVSIENTADWTQAIFSQQLSSTKQLQNIFNIIFQIIILLISPAMVLVGPVVLFEKKTAIKAIKRSIEIGTKNYLKNLLVIFCIGFTEFFISLLMAIFILSTISILLFMAMLPGGQLMALVLGIPAISMLLFTFTAWVLSFHYLAINKYYSNATNSK